MGELLVAEHGQEQEQEDTVGSVDPECYHDRRKWGTGARW